MKWKRIKIQIISEHKIFWQILSWNDQYKNRKKNGWTKQIIIFFLFRSFYFIFSGDEYNICCCRRQRGAKLNLFKIINERKWDICIAMKREKLNLYISFFLILFSVKTSIGILSNIVANEISVMFRSSPHLN